MTHQLQLNIDFTKVMGDLNRPLNISWREPEYDATFEQILSVGTTLTQIDTHLETIEFIFMSVITDDQTIEVHKNLSPEYWTIEECFIAFTTSITQLSLKASAADTQIYLFLGGTAE